MCMCEQPVVMLAQAWHRLPCWRELPSKVAVHDLLMLFLPPCRYSIMYGSSPYGLAQGSGALGISVGAAQVRPAIPQAHLPAWALPL